MSIVAPLDKSHSASTPEALVHGKCFLLGPGIWPRNPGLFFVPRLPSDSITCQVSEPYISTYSMMGGEIRVAVVTAKP